jgi:hypothetical protein
MWRRRLIVATGHPFPPPPRAWSVIAGAADGPIGCALFFEGLFDSLHIVTQFRVPSRAIAASPGMARQCDFIDTRSLRRCSTSRA